ncbi:MAG: imidazole glycerol phosphate synthase subunit HisH [Candidatus Zeuxoniibacter abyssi]|nr:MAG: imidazole glycerol phosphate synthase subunit HisH [Candidatus Persebacteraceae bacterium AB1(2)]
MKGIVIVDCGMGNLHSIHAGLCRTGTRMPITLSDKAADIAAAEKVVLPGDGHFDSCMKEIRRRGLCDELIRATREKPFLGICVGMQALYESSEEGREKGLGVLAGSVLGLPPTANKIPHMGWNETRRRKTHAILDNIPDDTRFYFIHSYYVPPDENCVAETEYGVSIAAVIGRDNLWATQFHPEKSGAHGIQILKNFVAN